MNYTLLIDAYSNQRVAVFKDGKLIKENQSNLPHSDTFMQLIDQTLNQSKISVSQLTEIVLNIGPGSFTGIRVALSIAKGLGYASDLRYLTYSSFDLIKNEINQPVLINGFSNFIYLRDGELMDCVSFDQLDLSKKYLTNSNIVKEKASKYGVQVVLADEIDIETLYKNINKKPLKINELNPLYLRKSQAEIQKESSKK